MDINKFLLYNPIGETLHRQRIAFPNLVLPVSGIHPKFFQHGRMVLS